jgi:hypothetical protein
MYWGKELLNVSETGPQSYLPHENVLVLLAVRACEQCGIEEATVRRRQRLIAHHHLLPPHFPDAVSIIAPGIGSLRIGAPGIVRAAQRHAGGEEVPVEVLEVRIRYRRHRTWVLWIRVLCFRRWSCSNGVSV